MSGCGHESETFAKLSTAVRSNRPEWMDSGMPIIRIQNLKNPSVPFNYYQGEVNNKFLVNEGDLLFAWSGTPGTSFGAHLWRGPKALLNQHIFNVHFNCSEISPRYLQEVLNQNVSEYVRQAQGRVGLAHITKPKFNDSVIPLPPLPEQHRIVAAIETHFARLDASVAALRRAQANLKRYRASVLKDACEGRLVPAEAELARSEGREYEPANVLLERILAQRRARWELQEKQRGKYREPSAPDASALPQLPDGWVWASLEQLVSVIRNGYSKRPQGDTGIPILRISAVRPMAVNLDDVRWVDRKENLSDFLIHPGDLLFTRYNGNPGLVGVCGVVPDGNRDTLHPDKLIRATLIQSETMPAFVQLVANVGISREFLSRRVRTTAGQSGISGTDLKAMPIPLPPLAEQRRIVAEVERRLSVAQQAEATVEASLARAERLRQSILKQAFSGRLVPQDPDDEPASALLERIRAEREAEAEASSAAKGKTRRGRATAINRTTMSS